MTTRTAALALVAACAAVGCRATSASVRPDGEASRPVATRLGDEYETATADAAQQAERIDAVMHPWARDDSPGCAVAVIRDREIVHAEGYGMADLERAVPITPDTVFDIGSISKQFTASAVLLAAAHGRLRLDDDVRVHVPALPAIGDTPTTIRHLLHHTGGLRDYGTLLMLGGSRVDGITTVRETIDVLARQRGLDFEPGTRHEYSNTGYFVLALAVEHATKRSLASYLDTQIFGPLGMTRTQVLDDPKRIVPGRAIGYAPAGGGWRIEMSGWEQTGDGAVMTTVIDLAKWDANFYDPKVGGRPLVDGLQTRGRLADGTQLDYAAGLVHGSYRGQPTVSHGGAWAGYRAQLERFAAMRTSIVVLCNAANAQPDALAHEIADVVLQEDLLDGPAPALPPPVALTPAELEAWVATYRETTTGEIVTVARTHDALELAGRGQRFVLVPTSARTVRLDPTPVVVEIEGTRPRRKLVVKEASPPMTFDEVELHQPTARELAELAGRYHSDEIGTEWTLTVEDGMLIATAHCLDEPNSVTAATRDEYSIAAIGATLQVTRDARGRVTGFLLGVGSTRGLRFDRAP